MNGARASAPVAFGVDVGGTKLLGVATDVAGTVLAEARAPTPTGDASDPLAADAGSMGDAVADAVVAVVAQLAVGSAAQDASLPVGVGVPGMCDRDGVLRFAPNLPAASGVDVAALLAARLTTATLVVENDATLAVLAEHELGSARGRRDVVMVTLGTGIGGGLVVDDRVVLGANGFAAEIGHVVVDPSGPRCPCGRRGCWERYASGSGLGRLAREAAHAGRLPAVVAAAGGDPEGVRGEHVTQAALAGDAGALGVFDELGWWVALGLTNLTAVLDPSCIVLGGGLAAAGDLLIVPTRRAYDELVEGGRRRPPVELVLAELGEQAGAVGAARLAARAGEV